MIKYVFLCMLMACSMQQVIAQITTTLTVNSNPTAVLSDWANDNTVMTYVVNCQKDIPFPVVIKAELKLEDNTVIATKDLAKATTYNLIRGTSVYFAKDIMPMETMIFTGTYKLSLERYGKLPAGSYQIVVTFVRAGTYEQISEVQNKFFNIIAIQLPVLIKPAKNDTLGMIEAQTAIIFRWTQVTPVSKVLPVYRIQVFEVLENQQGVQALRSNQPLLDIMVTRLTQYVWRPQLPFIDAPVVKRFIWTIQTLDADNNPLVQTDGNGESRSEPVEFFVRTHDQH